MDETMEQHIWTFILFLKIKGKYSILNDATHFVRVAVLFILSKALVSPNNTSPYKVQEFHHIFQISRNISVFLL
jgi:hypothetical protein